MDGGESERETEEKKVMTESPTENPQSPEIASKSSIADDELKENVKILTEKLSAALVNVSAKEDLVKQHAKVAEEAVAGWERAENEVALLKQQLDIALQQNLNLEVKASHLDGALKECVRQLRESREEYEKKAELEKQMIDLQTEVEAAKAENAALLVELEGLEKANSFLKQELLCRCEDLETVTIERDLSTQAAEAASKLQLESIKKVAKLEAECRRLQSMARKLSPQKSVGSEPLVLDIDRSKSKSPINSILSVEIDMMDDFLEMERLAALDETKTDAPIAEDNTPLTVELDLMSKRVIELEEKLQKLEAEKSELRNALDESLESLKAAGIKLEEVQKEIDAVNETREVLQFQIVGMEEEARTMSANVDELKLEVEEERIVSGELKSKCQELENELSRTIQEREVKINELTSEIEQERRVSAELKSKCLELEDELVSGELKSKCRELENELSRTIQECEIKIIELNSEIKEERRMSAELKSKCLELEDELSRLIEETDLQQNANSNGEVKVKQEDLAVAADKLTECQKTIASLGRQLQSLATLEDFLIDTSNIPDLSRGSPEENIWRLSSNEAFVPKHDSDFLRMSMEKYSNLGNGIEDSLPSSSTNHISAFRTRKSFGNSFF